MVCFDSWNILEYSRGIKAIKKIGTLFSSFLIYAQRSKRKKKYSGLIGIRCRGIFTSSAETRESWRVHKRTLYIRGDL